MRVVIDTNVLWVSISRKSESHWIFKAILDGSITICVTTDILDEYSEIMSLMLGDEASEAVLSVFDNLPNIEYITRYYRWLAIKADPDDRIDGPRQVCGLCRGCQCALYCYGR